MSSRQHYPLRELAETLRHELELQAVPSSLHQDGFPSPRSDLVYVLIDPRGYAAVEGDSALPPPVVLRRTAVVCMEPPPSSADDKHVALLKRAGAVFVLDQRAGLAMHRLGIPARVMRPGYSKSLDHFDPRAARPIDVMFLGTHSRRRTEYLARAAQVFSRHNCLLQVSDDAVSPGDTSSFLGPGRWPLLARTKVVVNIHRGDESRLEWRDVLDSIHAGAVVVTEHSSGIAPLVAGEHLLTASADSLPYVVEALVRDEDRLADLRGRAYERLSAWIPYALPVSVLRAALVELVGEPVGVGGRTGARGRKSPDRAPGAPAVEPVGRDSGRGSPTASRAGRATANDRRGVGAAAPTGRVTIELAHESPAWAARRSSRATILIALTGTPDGIETCLASLAGSRLRDFELVVVNAGASGRDGEVVLGWMQRHPRIAARLVLTDGNGVGVARNIGLDFARSPTCLILDPGQELYPRCLDVLTGTLNGMPDVTFVYPIQEVTGAPDAFVGAGGDWLMSFFGWNPGRLRQGNYLHAPVLIRTKSLRELGGFATDPRLDGFEEYDLWCRIGDRDMRGQLVAQVLARCSESGSSRSLVAIHPSPGVATGALMERAPRLMLGAFAAA